MTNDSSRAGTALAPPFLRRYPYQGCAFTSTNCDNCHATSGEARAHNAHLVQVWLLIGSRRLSDRKQS